MTAIMDVRETSGAHAGTRYPFHPKGYTAKISSGEKQLSNNYETLLFYLYRPDALPSPDRNGGSGQGKALFTK